MIRLTISIVLILLLTSCEELINEQDISKATVVALAPTNNSTLKVKKKINYTWQDVEGANTYKLQIATPNFVNAAQIKLDTLVTTTFFTIDSLKAGVYEWRIKAQNSTYSTIYTVNSFEVEK